MLWSLRSVVLRNTTLSFGYFISRPFPFIHGRLVRKYDAPTARRLYSGNRASILSFTSRYIEDTDPIMSRCYSMLNERVIGISIKQDEPRKTFLFSADAHSLDRLCPNGCLKTCKTCHANFIIPTHVYAFVVTQFSWAFIERRTNQ